MQYALANVARHAFKCNTTFMSFATSVKFSVPQTRSRRNEPIKNKMHAAVLCFYQRRLCMRSPPPITMLLHVSKIDFVLSVCALFICLLIVLSFAYPFNMCIILSYLCAFPSPFLNKFKMEKCSVTAMMLSAMWSSSPPPPSLIRKILQLFAMRYS